MRSPGTPSAAICIMGPTAAGKSALALALCERMDCEIISVDSAQVYRGMDIGTAKPDLATQRRIPHHLIDICDPAESYSAARFLRDAGDAVDKVLAHGRTPLLVGGTMLYFRALRQGLSELPAADPAVRAGITALAGREGWAAVHARLAEIDPETAARIHPRNRQRTQRALEVCLVSGQPMSRLLGSNAPEPGRPLRLLQLAVGPRERSTLWRLIERRFDAMLEQGFVDEVRVLHARGDLDPSLPSIRSVGYRQIWHFLEGGWSYADMRERAIIATRQLAKRQMTWLRSWPRLHWMQGEDAAAQWCDQALKLASDVSMWEVVGAES